jgi:hypothetical protein
MCPCRYAPVSNTKLRSEGIGALLGEPLGIAVGALCVVDEVEAPGVAALLPPLAQAETLASRSTAQPVNDSWIRVMRLPPCIDGA